MKDTERLTVHEFLDRWLLNTVKPGTQPTTHDRYKLACDRQLIPNLGTIQLDKLQPFHIQELYSKLAGTGITPRSVALAGTVLGTALRYAVRTHLLPSNPAADVQKPRAERHAMKFWNESQCKAFLAEAIKDRLFALYVLAIATGMRSGEMFALQWQDVDFGSGAVQVQRTLEEIRGRLRSKEPKTKRSRRQITLPLWAVDALKAHRERMDSEGHGSELVFPDTIGGPLRRNNFRERSYRPLIGRAGVPMMRVHDLRHTAASLLLAQGEHPKIVQERLGHSDIAVTLETYSHCTPTMQRAAADKLERMFGENGSTMAVPKGKEEGEKAVKPQ